MREEREFRELLVADLALVRGVAQARDVAAALQCYWDDRKDETSSIAAEIARIAGLPRERLRDVEAEADLLIAAAGGDTQQALTRRGGIDRSIHGALGKQTTGLSRALTQIGARARAPLRTVQTDRYVDFEVAGEGGMGIVYIALDTELSRVVALKMVRPDTGSGKRSPAPTTPVALARPAPDTPASKAFAALEARFLQEAWVTGGLEHPGVVPVHELGRTASGIPYYTMRFVGSQRTLGDAIGELRGGPAEDRLALLEPFLKLCDTVAYAHSRGVVHRDLKPDNVALGDFGEVVLLDWGLAKLVRREDLVASEWQERVREFREAGDLETVAGALGTPGYMAPEAARGRVDEVGPKSDIYSLGVLLFEILTGRLPYAFRTFAQYIDRVSHEDAPAAREVDANVPEALSGLAAGCLAREGGGRPESAAAVATAIRAWQAASAVDREVEGHVRDARAALAAAETTTADHRLRQVERAAGSLEQARTKRPGHERLDALRAQVDRLRETAVREREKASGRRLLGRVGVAVLLLSVVASLIVMRILEARRVEAVQARAETERERDAKAKALDEVLRLSEGKIVRGLADEIDELWPVHPDRAHAMEVWLERARRALAKRGEHQERLTWLRGQALSLTETGRGFEQDKLDWMEEVLEDLLTELDRLQESVAVVEARCDLAGTLRRRSLEDHADPWGETVDAIRKSDRYGGLEIVPQVGLVPLGPDPKSGLFEFAHLDSGVVPLRDADSGRLAHQNDTGIVLVLIPAGTFWMGAQALDESAPNHDPHTEAGESPVHEVTLSPFFLAKYECTQAQWRVLTGGENPSRRAAGLNLGEHTLTVGHPVEQVSWEDCEIWLRRWNLELPTEAQWEYACRAGSTTPWHTGEDPASLQGFANIADAYFKTHGGPPHWTYLMEVDDGHAVHAPVGTYRPNAFGAHDLHGNVSEWCRDMGLPYGPDPVTDPLRVETGTGVRVFRGGSWKAAFGDTRSSERGRADAVDRDSDIGVRPARALSSD